MFISNDLVRLAAQISITEILHQNGEKIKKVGNYFTLIDHDSLRIKNNLFYWNSINMGGNTVQFVMYYYQLTFIDAVNYILERNTSIKSCSPYKKTEKQMREYKITNFEESQTVNRAIAYLCNTRKISYSIVKELILKKLIYQDGNGNVVFKILNENNDFVGGEVRGTCTYKPYKGILAGSNQCYGFNIVCGFPRKAMFFESAIDLISFYELFRHKLNSHVLISLSGLKETILHESLSRYDIEYGNTYLCVDNDDAGNHFIERIKQMNGKIKVYRPFKKEKDWNELLINLKNNNS